MTAGAKGECRRILLFISAYLDGDLDASDCETIERHCRRCSRCADLVAGLRATLALCRKTGSLPLPEGIRQRAKASVLRLLEPPTDER
jgi:anti-sigma factor RsiW